ncbi:expansin-A17 [Oryza glaberrima]|uniref:Expansin n=2 Tax=Oryza TaxID=4527 RepID=A0A0D3GBW9_9ORYZ|nr:expansin-A17 [Oryza glaberrima]
MASSWNNPAIFLAAALAVATAAQVVTAGFTTDLYWQQQPAPGAVTPYKTSDWHDGSATFYGDPSGMGDDFGGACGYVSNDIVSLYSTKTAALSTPLFADGNGCGQCYELRCVKSPWCNPGSPSVVITGTNLCPPNWYLPNDDGGWCNPPRHHFDMAPPSFLKLAQRVAGIVPVQYRRVPCQRTGGVRFCLQGNHYWLLLYVMNVGGAGDVSSLSVKTSGGDGAWIQAAHNWGITYQVFAALDNSDGLTVKLTTYSTPQQTIIVSDAISPWWITGLCYQGSNNFY